MNDTNLVTRLQRWKDNRGALAALRCALRPALRSRAWPLIAQLTRLDSGLLSVYETVAGLWASEPDSHHAEAGNFGTVCKALCKDHETFDGRFRRLINCDTREELCERIAPIALAAQAKGIAIDYERLFDDLRYYAGAGIEHVRVSWAQSYWEIQP